ncbi:MAG TPA: hypothetical protein VD794_00065 [Flavisolibacter sp.]|nr:hypothetical protein [Flavisolibacter sp.]
MAAISEALKEQTIEDFRNEEPCLKQFVEAMSSSCRYKKTVFMSRQFLPVVAAYDTKEGRFTELELEVYGHEAFQIIHL